MNRSRFFVRIAWLLLLAAALLPATYAAPPTLQEDPQQPLPGIYRTGQRYTVSIQYRDPDGDRPLPSKSLLIDQAQSGEKASYQNPQVIGTDFESGVTLSWDVPAFIRGGHRAEFVVTSADGNTARYPYEFVVEDLMTKWIILGIGVLVGLLFIPFLVYVLARAMNRRGDPSRAARVGLLFGILASAALFIYLFATTFGVLAYAIGVVAALTLLVLVLTRR